MAINIIMAGTPKANGKHESLPKQCMLCRNSGIKNVENNDPMYTANANLVVKYCKYFSC